MKVPGPYYKYIIMLLSEYYVMNLLISKEWL